MGPIFAEPSILSPPPSVMSRMIQMLEPDSELLASRQGQVGRRWNPHAGLSSICRERLTNSVFAQPGSPSAAAVGNWRSRNWMTKGTARIRLCPTLTVPAPTINELQPPKRTHLGS